MGPSSFYIFKRAFVENTFLFFQKSNQTKVVRASIFFIPRSSPFSNLQTLRNRSLNSCRPDCHKRSIVLQTVCLCLFATGPKLHSTKQMQMWLHHASLDGLLLNCRINFKTLFFKSLSFWLCTTPGDCCSHVSNY